jgi:hypothetical protein
MVQRVAAPGGRDQVLKSFRQLLDARAAARAHPATKEEAAERQRDRETVEAASAYTVEAIVKGLAELQLEFGDSVGRLAEKLLREAAKVGEMRRAIDVENRRVAELRNVRLAADALDILVHEHEAGLRAFEDEARERRATFERERADQRAVWERDQAQFDVAEREYAESLGRERRQAEDDYAYETERQRKIDADGYAERRSALEREIEETGREKERAWAERERLAAERRAKIEEYATRAEALPAELEAAVRKAREDGVRDAAEAEQVKADLLEREIAASEKVNELKIESLDAAIAQQAARIEGLSAQLQAALQQAQGLAMRAVEGAARGAAQPGRGE